MQLWIIVNEEPTGPYELETVRQMRLNGTTPVWHSGLSDWRPASTVSELAGWLEEDAGQAACEDAAAMSSVEVPPVPEPTGEPEPQIPSIPEPGVYVSSPIDEPQEPREKCPPTYLAWSIVAMILCCIPTGIVALVYSSKVTNAWHAGEYERSRHYSEMVEWWLMITIVAGLVWAPFSIILL